jgi:D-alanyl-D-alanine carboxypeptidase
MQLDAEGVLSLDDTVEQWLPGLVPDGGSITIRNTGRRPVRSPPR